MYRTWVDDLSPTLFMSLTMILTGGPVAPMMSNGDDDEDGEPHGVGVGTLTMACGTLTRGPLA